MQPRTKRQREILDYITQFIEQEGHVPSYQRIALHFNISSKSAVAKHIAALESQGLLSRQRENGVFGLRVNQKDAISESVYEIQWLDIPFRETPAEEWENQPLYVPRILLGYLSPERIRAFKVENDSMIDEQICSGDIALVEKRPYVRDGDIVVALLENQKVVLKSFFRVGGTVELRAANSNFLTMHLPANKIKVLGVYRGLLRPLG